MRAEGGSHDLLRRGVPRDREIPRAGRGRAARYDLREHGTFRERSRGVYFGPGFGEWAAPRLRQPGRSGRQEPDLCWRKYGRLAGWGNLCTSGLLRRGATRCEAPPGQEQPERGLPEPTEVSDAQRQDGSVRREDRDTGVNTLGTASWFVYT